MTGQLAAPAGAPRTAAPAAVRRPDARLPATGPRVAPRTRPAGSLPPSRIPAAVRRSRDIGIELGSGEPLTAALQAEMGARFGTDLSAVRLHRSPSAAASAAALGAAAYTVGHDIVIGPRPPVPGSDAHRALLVHELTHVVQQSRPGRGAPGAALEAEARQAAAGVSRPGPFTVRHAGPLAVACQPAPGAVTQDQTGARAQIIGRLLGALGLPTSARLLGEVGGGMADKLITDLGAARGAKLGAQFAAITPKGMLELTEGFQIGALEGLISPLTDLFGFFVLSEQLDGMTAQLLTRALTADLAGEAGRLRADVAAVGHRVRDRIATEWAQGWRRILSDIAGAPAAFDEALNHKAYQLGMLAGEQIIASLEAPFAAPSAAAPPPPSLLSTPAAWLQSKAGALDAWLLDTPWRQIGGKVGYASGWITAQVAIFVFTRGVGNAIEEVGGALGEIAGELSKVSRAAGAAVGSLERLAKLVGSGISAVEAAIGELLGIALKPIKGAVEPVMKLMEDLRAFLQKLLGVAEKEAAPALESAAGRAGRELTPPPHVTTPPPPQVTAPPPPVHVTAPPPHAPPPPAPVHVTTPDPPPAPPVRRPRVDPNAWKEGLEPRLARIRGLRATDPARAAAEAEALEKDLEAIAARNPTTNVAVDPQVNADVDAAFDELEEIRRRGIKNPRIGPGKGTAVPTSRGAILDMENIALNPGETVEEAVTRVREVIGQRISDTPLAKAWSDARTAVLRGRSIASMSDAELIDAYKAAQQKLWRNVRGTPAETWLHTKGFDMDATGAPRLRVTGDFPIEQVRISLDHEIEKAINARRALDADNLILEFHDANSLREIKQMRHPGLRPGATPGPGWTSHRLGDPFTPPR